jgi:hypothetical protein
MSTSFAMVVLVRSLKNSQLVPGRAARSSASLGSSVHSSTLLPEAMETRGTPH